MSSLIALVGVLRVAVRRRWMSLLLVLIAFGLAPRAAAAQAKPMTVTSFNGMTFMSSYTDGYCWSDDDCSEWTVRSYRLDFTVKADATMGGYLYVSPSCGSYCVPGYNVPGGRGALAPGQSVTTSVFIFVPDYASGSSSVGIAAAGATITGWVYNYYTNTYEPTGYSPVNPWDSFYVTVNVTNGIATLPPMLADYRPSVTPKAATEVVPFGASLSRSFTIQNAGIYWATYTLTATCGNMTPCTPSKTSTTLPPGGTDVATVSFTTPNTVNASNAVNLIATFVTPVNPSIADTGSRPTVTPALRPSVGPHSGTIAAVPGAGGSTVFYVTDNGNLAQPYSSIAAACSGWITGCSVTDVSLDEQNNRYVVTVNYSAPSTLGGPSYPTATLKLVAQLGVAADTGALTVALGYYKPTVTPKTTIVTEPANTPRGSGVTLTNTGNLATGYSIAMVCTVVTTCQAYQTWLYLNPGQSSGISFTYKAPPIGQTGTVKIIATHTGTPSSLTEADTALITTTGAEVLAPTITLSGAPVEGTTTGAGLQSVSVSACDADGQLQTPTITANGVTVSPSFTSGSSTSCNSTKDATVSFVAVAGANTINLSVSDGIHTTTLVRHFTYNELNEARPIVTALVSSHLLRGGQQWADTFSVRNAGPLTVSYALSAGCSGGFPVCAPSSSSISVGPGQTVKMAVNFTTSTTTTGAVVWPVVTYTGPSGSTTVNDVYTTLTLDQIWPTAVITGPAPNTTIAAFPNLSVAWCDADGTLVTHTVVLDGVPFADTFASQTQPGCTTAGASNWSNVSLTLGAHTVTATATDVAGHVTTTSRTFTLALPAIAAFQPDVTPRTATPYLIPNEQTLTWAVRNVGTLSAQYQLTANCTTITTAGGCSLDKPTVTLAPGAVDSVRMTFVLTGWPSTSKTLKLSARYTDIVGRVTADTAAVTAQIPNLATLYQPEIRQPTGTLYQEPNVIAAYNFYVTNRGIAPVKYHMDEAVASPFIIYTPYVNDTLTVLPGQTANYQVQVRSPVATGATAQISIGASYTFDGQTVSSAIVANVATRATAPSVLISNQAGTSQNASGATGSTTFVLTNIGVGLLEGELSPAVSICNGMVFNCRYAPRVDGRTISLAPSASTMVTVLFDITPASTGSTFGAVEIRFDGKPGTPSAFLQRYGSVFIMRSLVADGVDVTPDNLPLRYNANQTDRTYPFVIRNTGTVVATFDYTITCAGAGVPGSPTSVACSSVSGQTHQLAQDQADTVTAHFNTTATDADGYVTLTATKVGNASISDVGTLAVRLSVTIADISVAADTVNRGAMIARDQCVTLPASSAAYQCGDLVIVHPLPATMTMNTTRAPALIYNSAHATGHSVIAANVRIKPGIVPAQVRATLKVRNNAGAEVVNVSRPIQWMPDWSDGLWHRVAVQFDASTTTLVDAGKQAGLFKYTLEVRSENDAALAAKDSGFVVVVDRSSSVFGKGWWLDGLEQVIMLPDTSKRLWVGGDGSARVYTWLSNNVWTVRPTLDRPDSLVLTGSTYRRLLSNGAYVEFEFGGRQTAMRNERGHVTQVAWASTPDRPTSITLPVPAGSPTRVYTLNYNASSHRLTSVVAPAGTIARQVLVRPVLVGGTWAVDRITQPDGKFISFGFDAAGRVRSLINRRLFTTAYGYDEGGALRSDTLYMAGTGTDVIDTFCAAETAGLSACGGAMPLASNVRTTYDGPRTDVSDVTTFSLSRYGAPVTIVNALGQTSRVERTDTTWPLLTTKTVDPRGATSTVTYDLTRGLPLETSVLRPNSLSSAGVDATKATTQYTWHEKWDQVTIVKSPTNITTTLTYDMASGDLLEHHVGNPTTRSTSYTYDFATRLVASVTTQATTSPTQYAYDALGNLRTVTSPRALVSTVTRDYIGRDSVVQTPINDLPTTRWRYRSIGYDTLDRVIAVAETGPTSATSSAPVQTVLITTTYDNNGNVLRSARSAFPDLASLSDIATAAEYDGADRLTRRYDPNKSSNQTLLAVPLYDAAGNAKTITAGTGTQTFQYDALNRPIQRTVSGVANPYTLLASSDVQTFAYDSSGNLVSARNRYANVGRVYTLGGALAYDTLQIANADLTFGSHTYVTNYGYDLEGRRFWVNLPTNLGLLGDVSYTYNTVTGDPETVNSTNAGSYRYRYTAAGQLDSLVRSDGSREKYRYDLVAWPQQRVEAGSLPTQGFHNDAFQFDGRGKMLSVQSTLAGATKSDAFTYSGLGAVLSASGPQSETYTRDPLGNAVTRNVTGASGWSESFTHLYEQHSTRLSSAATSPSTKTDSLFVQYDELGRVALRTQHVRFPSSCAGGVPFCETPGQSLAWSALTHRYAGDGQLLYSTLRTSNDVLAQIDTAQIAPYAAMGRAVDEEYRYDALGRRVWRRAHRDTYCHGVNAGQYPVCGGYVERTVYDGDQVLYEVRQPADSTTSVADMESDTPVSSSKLYGVVAYLHGAGIDQPLGMVRSRTGATIGLVLHRNWQGSIDFATGTNGIVIDCWMTNASGCEDIQWPGRDQSIGFQRPTTDIGAASWWGTLVGGNQNATGVIDMRARQFDPKIGQFLQEDPMGIGGGVNTYAFAGGDAVNFRDPSGMCPEGFTESPDSRENEKTWCVPVGMLDPVVVTAPRTPWWDAMWSNMSGQSNWMDGWHPGGDPNSRMAMAVMPWYVGGLSGGKAVELHHIFPQAFREAFRGIIKIDEHVMELDREIHRAIHFGRNGGAWNNAWEEFFEQNPNGFTALEAYQYALRLIKRFGINGRTTWYK